LITKYITEIVPLSLLAGSTPGSLACSGGELWPHTNWVLFIPG